MACKYLKVLCSFTYITKICECDCHGNPNSQARTLSWYGLGELSLVCVLPAPSPYASYTCQMEGGVLGVVRLSYGELVWE